MAESTLSLPLSKLKAQVGDYFGYGYGNESPYTDPAWTDAQLMRINQAGEAGLRKFYVPLLPDGTFYEWSFLKPTVELTLPSGDSAVQLPDDFGFLAGPVLLTESGRSFCPVQVTGQVRTWASLFPDRSGVPEGLVVEPTAGTTTIGSTRYSLRAFPAADQDYTIRVTYSVLPDYLTISSPYPLGGAAHAETVRCAWMCAAEEMNDERGLWTQRFAEQLLASVQYDRRLKPEILGYNGDRSDEFWAGRSWCRDRATRGITFNGTQY